MTERAIRIVLREGDAAATAADVIGLKYAQAFHGVDGLFAEGLALAKRPLDNEYVFAKCSAEFAVQEALFVGVPPLFQFGYHRIREFAARVLEIVARERPRCARLLMTLHGPGYGLDETEAALAEIGGLEDAIRAGDVPQALEEIVIAERDGGRVGRLADSLTRELGSARLRPGEAWALKVHPEESEERRAPGSVGERSEDKPHVFVAMPFDPSMDDVYHYGIQRVVHERGWLCERLDQTAFTGDVVERIKVRIRTAKVVIADLTGANPNVYLEVGYAWGVGRPTVFLAKSAAELRFDVQGQRCLPYSRIQDLERDLAREIDALQRAGTI